MELKKDNSCLLFKPAILCRTSSCVNTGRYSDQISYNTFEDSEACIVYRYNGRLSRRSKHFEEELK